MVTAPRTTDRLAIHGGPRAIQDDHSELFRWPIITAEDEEAVLGVLRKPNYEDDEQVDRFEEEFARWCGVQFALNQSCGTNAVQAAMFACGVGIGDEVIAPSSTYWATVLQCFSLGATMVFADIDPLTLNIDPADLQRRISDRTKAIVVVHQLGYPADMDAINAIARPRGIRVIEDASHAHGTRHRGRMAGTLGDVAAFSLCGKPLSVGEGGMLVTNDRDLYERAIAWGHNFLFNATYVRNPALLEHARLPMGGVTSRMHNLSGAVGRVQLRHYDERRAEIDRAMNYFWDLMEGTPGLIAHRPPRGSGSTMGGWYTPHAIYDASALHGLSAAGFVQAVRAEGFHALTRNCIREPLHVHPLVNTVDVYGHGRPTRLANAARDVRQPRGSLPVTESVRAFTVPPFRRYRPDVIEAYADLFKKVVTHHEELLATDPGDESVVPDDRGDG